MKNPTIGPIPAPARYYVAYGSNLSLTRMQERCPTAKVVGKDILKDMRLRFRGLFGNAVATIEPESGFSVPVLIYKVLPEDEKSLDHYEGWPTLYRKEEIAVTLDDQLVTAFVYIMNEDRYPYNQPGGCYFGTILEGYLTYDFDVKILIQAIENNQTRTGANST